VITVQSLRLEVMNASDNNKTITVKDAYLFTVGDDMLIKYRPECSHESFNG